MNKESQNVEGKRTWYMCGVRELGSLASLGMGWRTCGAKSEG